MSDKLQLKGTYTSPSGTVLIYNVLSVNDQVFIGFDKGSSVTISNIFPTWKGTGFMISKDDFENFKKNVVNKPEAEWQVTKTTLVNVPGSWTMDDSTSSGGHKRSGKSGNKRSGHKRRKSHKRSCKSRRH
jgi:hypothetical protein